MNKHEELELKQEISRLLEWLGEFGKDPTGGISRFLYDSEWIKAQKGLEELMKREGFKVEYDEVGNLFGRMEGKVYKNETILTGSHIDTVKNGGLYDGQYGIVAGIIALRYLKKTYGQPLRNIEVVSISEEEGSRFPYTFWGVKNIVGKVEREKMEGIKDFQGNYFIEVMEQAGFGFKEGSSESRKDLKIFLEIHVEQGGVLEREKKSVGVVEYIVGQRRFSIEITGESNHAGTTPMTYRRDAVEATSKIIAMIIDLAKGYGDPFVATVGKIEVKPNVVNVVPEKVLFTLDVRHTKKDVLVKFTEYMIQETKRVAMDLGVEVDIDLWMDTDPVEMDHKVVGLIKEQCEKNNLNYRMMASGAGHDAQIMARFVPTGMMLVPSHKGISHSPAEYTEPEDLVEGVKALIGVLYELGYIREKISSSESIDLKAI